MRAIAILALFALAACGARGTLKPPPGGSLPVKPYGATATPTPDKLMTPDAQARPSRGDDPSGEGERGRDEFDLPPPR